MNYQALVEYLAENLKIDSKINDFGDIEIQIKLGNTTISETMIDMDVVENRRK